MTHPRNFQAISENAWAKINLTLHVTGRRDDGYHLLDSLVVFVISSDEITVSPAAELSLSVEGPMASSLDKTPHNLVLGAARALRDFAVSEGKKPEGATIALKKHLPVAAGIGGGSADAAATLRALNQLWCLNFDNSVLEVIGATLGADIPVCIASNSARIRGIGTQLTPVSDLPIFYMVLVNPGVTVSTPRVFNALIKSVNAPMKSLPISKDVGNWLTWLKAARNDLYAPALSLCPEIADVLSVLEQQGALLARMSGSGATCIGIFDGFDQAQAAAVSILKAHPSWWVDAAETV